MAFLADTVFDNGLTTLDTNGTRLDITVGEATNYTEATGTYNGTTQLSAGSDTVNTTAPGDASSGTGRSVTVPAITAGTVSASETVTYWALTNGTDTLYATGALSAGQAVTIGNPFTLTEIEIFLRDATAV